MMLNYRMPYSAYQSPYMSQLYGNMHSPYQMQQSFRNQDPVTIRTRQRKIKSVYKLTQKEIEEKTKAVKYVRKDKIE